MLPSVTIFSHSTATSPSRTSLALERQRFFFFRFRNGRGRDQWRFASAATRKRRRAWTADRINAASTGDCCCCCCRCCCRWPLERPLKRSPTRLSTIVTVYHQHGSVVLCWNYPTDQLLVAHASWFYRIVSFCGRVHAFRNGHYATTVP